MWESFHAEYPQLKTTSSRVKNKGPVISFCKLRNIFDENLQDILSFRKAGVNTCQYCDEKQNKINQISSAIKSGNLRWVKERHHLQKELEANFTEGEIRFAYDKLVLAKKQGLQKDP